MGQSNNVVMNVHICGLDLKDKNNYESQKKILNLLFPSIDTKRSGVNYCFKYNNKLMWNAFLYTDKNTQNFKLVNETILTEINRYNEQSVKEKEKAMKNFAFKNHMIVLFVNDNDSDIKLCEEFSKDDTIDKLNDNYPLLLFIFKDINRENLYYRDYFFDYSYIRCINLNSITYVEENKGKSSKEDLIALYLQSLLYNNYDSYFTERGHKIIDEIDPLSNKPMDGIYLPIILVGTPGVGKSTFINILNGSRISKASSSDNPVTSKSAIYDVRIPGKETEIPINNKNLRQEAFIRFIDTPGFDLEKDVENALNEINRIFKEFKDGKERIPVILYFMNKSGRNASKDEKKTKKRFEILQVLKKNNGKIIFVITHFPKNSRWQKHGTFMQDLKEHGLKDLIEEDESNIIKCDLVGDNAYGVKEIFKKIYRYLNLIEDKDHNQTEEIYTDSLIEEIKKKSSFEEKLAYIKSKTKLFNEFQSREDILAYGKKKANILMGTMSLAAAGAGSIPIPFVDVGIVLNILGATIIGIGKAYGYVWKKISKNDLISIYRGELYQKKNDIEKDNNDIIEVLKIIGEIFAKGFMTLILLNIDDVIKSIWGIGTLIGMAVGAAADAGIIANYAYKAKNYFESKCKEDDGTIFFCTRCAEYEVIFRKFKQFENFDLIYPQE